MTIRKHQLKLCPFCGGEAETEERIDVQPVIDLNGAYADADVSYFERTGCPKCDIWFWIGEDELEGTTAEKWNRRA